MAVCAPPRGEYSHRDRNWPGNRHLTIVLPDNEGLWRACPWIVSTVAERRSGEGMPQILIFTQKPRSTTIQPLFQFNLSHLLAEAQLLVLLARTSANGTLQVEIQ